LKDAFQKAGGKVPSGGQVSGAAGSLAKMLLIVGGLAATGYGVSKSVIVVQPGHLGIVYNRIGGLNEHLVCHEGLNFIIPWFQRPILFE